MLKIEKQVRVFSYNGAELADPGENLSLEEVRDVYSATFPEITSASIEGPETKGNKLVYTFRRAVGTKGSTQVSPRTVVKKGNDGLPYVTVVPAGQKTWMDRVREHVSRWVDWLDHHLPFQVSDDLKKLDGGL